jgi:tRNA pseudouridine38-40 synthase
MPNIRLTLEYDGTRFFGWQRQPGRATLQGTLEAAVRRISGEKVNVIGAGRTDRGVHALGQVANFQARSQLSPKVWQQALNAVLPDDIIIVRASRALDAFHSRYHAVEKIYEYRILNRRIRCAIGHQYRWIVYPPLDVDRMRRAAKWLRERHDFSAFRGGGHQNAHRSPICWMKSVRMIRQGDEIRLIFRADRFLYQMVRALVGTLVEVGRRKRTAEDVRSILASKDRGRAGQTAPPRGLFLMKVLY